MEKVYKSQVKLLLDVLPLVAKEKCFALHGGTAINLFVRNMPRLSVDIDLTYLQIEDWDTSIGEINNALSRIKSGIEKSMNATAVLKAEVSKLLISKSRHLSNSR
ncbi:nucleotidyl transferase AbiEii/AbiGii toxin family protein [Pedobacter agri]|uniref:nucleotidyl transferase AbiEii/AbiGii toxin family protein n=1 Tax=Pedobacter agri TaxID=454586 RepID=UPI00292FBD90|nr:nucleotidyl transferase AbiEii/AbiGii toxin family protein [Pedobacter agri]